MLSNSMAALDPPSTAHRALFGAAVAAGVATLAVTWTMASGATIPLWEESAFRTLNELPDWIEGPGWIIMQLGSFIAILIVMVVSIVLLRDYRLAGRLASAGLAAWLLSKLVKAIVERGRPDEFFSDIILRPGSDGLGFSSGHAAVSFALATLIGAALPRTWCWIAWSVAGAAGLMRIYTAAHLPLDVIGGWGLGLAVGGAIALIPVRQTRRLSPD